MRVGIGQHREPMPSHTLHANLGKLDLHFRGGALNWEIRFGFGKPTGRSSLENGGSSTRFADNHALSELGPVWYGGVRVAPGESEQHNKVSYISVHIAVTNWESSLTLVSKEDNWVEWSFMAGSWEWRMVSIAATLDSTLFRRSHYSRLHRLNGSNSDMFLVINGNKI